MVAFDIMDKEGKPDGAAAKRVTAAALARGLVLLTCGSQGQTIRILVPLTVTEEHLDEGGQSFWRRWSQLRMLDDEVDGSNAGISPLGSADQDRCSDSESIAYLKSPASRAVGIDH